MIILNDRQKILICIEKLKTAYPDAKCSLEYSSPLEILVAARLSAQCTDIRVNTVTPALFKRFPNAKAFASADIHEIEEYIRPCGLYKTKAKNISEMCKKIVNEFNSKVPDNMEDLLSLPGIGRKTANLILGDVYKRPAIVVDTHFIRLTNRLGFHKSKDPYKIEQIMKNLVPDNDSSDFCHRIVLHGRSVCTSRSPKCSKCCIKEVCKDCRE